MDLSRSVTQLFSQKKSFLNWGFKNTHTDHTKQWDKFMLLYVEKQKKKKSWTFYRRSLKKWPLGSSRCYSQGLWIATWWNRDNGSANTSTEERNENKPNYVWEKDAQQRSGMKMIMRMKKKSLYFNCSLHHWLNRQYTSFTWFRSFYMI